jgi:hypothetical protein
LPDTGVALKAAVGGVVVGVGEGQPLKAPTKKKRESKGTARRKSGFTKASFQVRAGIQQHAPPKPETPPAFIRKV